MSCCGKKRAQARRITQVRKTSKLVSNKASQHEMKHDTMIYFQYIGKKKLTVVGPNTHKHYHFDSPGAVVIVDPKDTNSLSAVTILRRVTRARNNTQKF